MDPHPEMVHRATGAVGASAAYGSLVSGPSARRLRSKRSTSCSNSTKALAPWASAASPFWAVASRAIADRAARMEVLGHPPETDRPERAQPFEVLGHLQGDRSGRSGAFHMNGFGPVGENERGFDIARMHAVAHFHPLERPRGIAEAVPRACDRQHLESHPQVAGNDIHCCDIAAVARDDDELAHPAAMETFADLRIGADHGSRRKRQRAGKLAVLVRLADLLHRQKAHRQVGR